MSDGRLRVFVITRKHLGAMIVLGAVIVGMWSVLSRETSLPASAPVAGVRSELSLDRPIREVPSAKGMMALTINVDWGNDELLKMLDVLDRHQVKATFFLTGRWAKLYPDLAREIADRGHEIGNHGLSHAHPTQLTREQLVELIAGNTAVLENAQLASPPSPSLRRHTASKIREWSKSPRSSATSPPSGRSIQLIGRIRRRKLSSSASSPRRRMGPSC